jgi:hypothetical protein
MNLQWDPKIGPAAFISFGGALAVLITLGVAWGTITTKLDHVLSANIATDHTINTVQRDNLKRDEKIATQSAQISGIQSTVNFIVPSLQRIEQRIEAAISTNNPPKAKQ